MIPVLGLFLPITLYSFQQPEEEEEVVTGMRSHPDVELSILFPSYPDKRKFAASVIVL